VNNSSPFFGSHGGVYTNLTGADRVACVVALLRAWGEVCREDECSVANLVEPLNNRDASVYAETLVPWRTDERIGQVVEDINADPSEMTSRYHQKTRNMLRKAERQGFAIREEPAAMAFLHEVHAENMAAIGGTPKAAGFFQALREHLAGAYTIHTASRRAREANGSPRS
jgi:hypothetical protein